MNINFVYIDIFILYEEGGKGSVMPKNDVLDSVKELDTARYYHKPFFEYGKLFMVNLLLIKTYKKVKRLLNHRHVGWSGRGARQWKALIKRNGCNCRATC